MMPTRTELPPARLINRELSWLDSSEHLLELAADESLPLLERVKFCAIFSAILDEFFMVRVAGLVEQEASGLAVLSADGLTPSQALEAIRARVAGLTQHQGRLWKKKLQPALEENGIVVVSIGDCTEKDLVNLERPRGAVLLPDGHRSHATGPAVVDTHPDPLTDLPGLRLAAAVDVVPVDLR